MTGQPHQRRGRTFAPRSSHLRRAARIVARTRVAWVPGVVGPAALRSLILVVVVASAGCLGGGEQPAAVQAPSTVEVPCSQAIDAVDGIGPSYVARGSAGGFVALPSAGLLPSGSLQLGRTGSAGSELEGFRFSKFGLLVRRARSVSVEVTGSPGEAVLDYVHPDTPAGVMRVGPCISEREWVVFAGGVWVIEPGCVEVLATSGNESVAVQLPVGAPCEADQ